MGQLLEIGQKIWLQWKGNINWGIVIYASWITFLMAEPGAISLWWVIKIEDQVLPPKKGDNLNKNRIMKYFLNCSLNMMEKKELMWWPLMNYNNFRNKIYRKKIKRNKNKNSHSSKMTNNYPEYMKVINKKMINKRISKKRNDLRTFFYESIYNF